MVEESNKNPAFGADCESEVDILIVGAGVAGCALALSLAETGLNVWVVEAKADINDAKKLCTTFIQPSALPVIEKLGLKRKIEEEGGVKNSASFWTRYGWAHAPETENMKAHPLHGYSIRREILDPLLRSQIQGKDNVSLHMGMKVIGLKKENGRFNTAEILTSDGQTKNVNAKLIVLADGRHSRTVEMAGVPFKSKFNNRSVFFAYYKNLPLKSGLTSQFWGLDPDFAFAYPFDDGRTMLCLYVDKNRAKKMVHDLDRHFEEIFSNLSEGPNMATAERISKIRRMFNMDNTYRHPSHEGLALIGDTALSSDPVAGIGCGWAFQSADWLAEEVKPVLTSASFDQMELERALKRYSKKHRRNLGPHHYFIADNSSSRKMNLMERMIAFAAVHDEVTAERLHLYTARLASPWILLNPSSVLRMAGVSLINRFGSNRSRSQTSPKIHVTNK